MVAVCGQIEEPIGNDKIYWCVLINPTTAHDDAIVKQCIDILRRLISHNFDHKLLKYSEKFDEHNYPRKN